MPGKDHTTGTACACMSFSFYLVDVCVWAGREELIFSLSLFLSGHLTPRGRVFVCVWVCEQAPPVKDPFDPNEEWKLVRIALNDVYHHFTFPPFSFAMSHLWRTNLHFFFLFVCFTAINNVRLLYDGDACDRNNCL